MPPAASTPRNRTEFKTGFQRTGHFLHLVAGALCQLLRLSGCQQQRRRVSSGLWAVVVHHIDTHFCSMTAWRCGITCCTQRAPSAGGVRVDRSNKTNKTNKPHAAHTYQRTPHPPAHHPRQLVGAGVGVYFAFLQCHSHCPLQVLRMVAGMGHDPNHDAARARPLHCASCTAQRLFPLRAVQCSAAPPSISRTHGLVWCHLTEPLEQYGRLCKAEVEV